MTDTTTLYILVPEMILVGAATLIFVVGAFVRLRGWASGAAAAALVLAGVALYAQDQRFEIFAGSSGAWLSGPMVVDAFGQAARWLAVASGLVLVCLVGQRSEQPAEEAGSLLLTLAGLMLAAASGDLILIFAGLELVSIPTYVLLYVGRHDARGQEAASKYFFLSILSSAVFLYGLSLLYGAGGSTKLGQIAAVVSGAAAGQGDFSSTMVPLSLLLVFAGLAFRLAAVPFHFYAPDVYQGTSNANAALLSTLPKIAGLAVLARLLLAAAPGWESLGWKLTLVASVLTMTLGNVLALWQNSVRRLLAYSSIAHAGYMLIGVAVALALRTTAEGAEAGLDKPFDGLGSAMFYLGVYMAATLGTFAALVYLGRDGRQVDSLDDLAGLNRIHPLVALAIAGFMFSLAGIPPLAGFFGKFVLLFSALTLDQPTAAGTPLRPWFIGLAIVTVVNAAIAAAYYLRVIGVVYFRPPTEATARRTRPEVAPGLAMGACVVLVLLLGLLPGRFLELANLAGRSVRPIPVQNAGVMPGGDREPVASAAKPAAAAK